MIWVLTAEPYHDNSEIVGAYKDLTKATAKLHSLMEEAQSVNCPECWMLTAFEDDVEHEHLNVFTKSNYTANRAGVVGKIVLHRYERSLDGGMVHRLGEVDPLTFDWVRKSE